MLFIRNRRGAFILIFGNHQINTHVIVALGAVNRVSRFVAIIGSMMSFSVNSRLVINSVIVIISGLGMVVNSVMIICIMSRVVIINRLGSNNGQQSSDNENLFKTKYDFVVCDDYVNMNM